jgi:hypothetical protein
LASAAAFAWTAAIAEDTALAAGPSALGIADDDPAPRQGAAQIIAAAVSVMHS